MGKTLKKESPQEIIEQWLERDLTQAAADDELPPAFEVDDLLRQIDQLLAAERRPILTGESGVGKTAAVYELVRRVHAGNGPACLQGKRILQFSLMQRASSLKHEKLVRPEVLKLCKALLAIGQDMVPFIRDVHVAGRLDLESQLQFLATRFRGPVLCEGLQAGVEKMLDETPELEQHYATLNVPEPGLDQAARILSDWADHQAERHHRRYTPEALEQALHLTHRFLPRSQLPRKAIDLLGQLGGAAGTRQPVTETDVVERFCHNHSVPRALADPRAPLDLGEVESRFRAELLGQPDAVAALVRMIGLIKAGLSDVRRPFGVFLFVGPTGVGKTHLAQLLAEYLFGSNQRVVRLNMADYQTEDAAKVLFGDPDGWRMAGMRGVLTQRIMGHTFAVVLLDEFEKAHAKVHDRFLQLVDEGSFINGANETVSCRSTILIATSNVGAEVYRGHTFGFTRPADVQAMDREIDRRLEEKFRFEFLNRFDQIVHFHPLSREDIRAIALRELQQLQERIGLKYRRLCLEVDEAVLDWLAVHGYDPDYGARLLRRTIERNVVTGLAELIVREDPAPQTRVALTITQNRIRARLLEPPAPAAPAKEHVTLPVGTGEQIRSLDRESLLKEAEDLLARAQDRLEALEQRRQECSALLAAMNEPGFWDRSEERRQVLDRFRELDVAIQVESRFAGPLLRLAELKRSALEPSDDLRPLARSLEAAASALRDWEDHLAEEGPSAVWLVIANADPLHPAGQWITDLVEMELAWCRSLRLSASVVAYELVDETLARVVLEIEGPGAAVYLALEEGVHRLRRPHAADARARMNCIPRRPPPTEPWPAVAPTRQRRGLFNLELSYSARLQLDDRGLVVQFVGGNAETLSHTLSDLQQAWKMAPPQQADVARVYGESGTGARDPRTGVVVPRLKDVLRGRLDKFLEGWRRRSQ